ncbi:hypothetical protein D9758_016517 [Tetrapyrgos nigripes]|uniref:Peptidase C14 caspase domain-containing protein n=1 Tax=Tetrapyrgos nigripes TaxID=182062 RepID=A0A8H5CLJ7_9AGAR|nr:hypothetical protein D9758_016517 [Tetrapyrgos nigripes]
MNVLCCLFLIARSPSLKMYLHWIDVTPGSVAELLSHLQRSPPPSRAQHVNAVKVEAHSGAVIQIEEPAVTAQSQEPQAAPEALQSARLFALIIGIDNYEDEKIDDLHGAVADADAFQHFLISKLGVPVDRIVNLRNEQATRDAMLNAIRDLASKPQIGSEDPIFIYYAGHGGEADPPPSWQTGSKNGMIQMLLPHDFAFNGSKEARKQGIFDIQLSQILTEIAKNKSDNITVFFDSCHSGSGTRNPRDETLTIRGVELPQTYQIAKDALEGGQRLATVAPGYEKHGLSSHVLLAACTQGQTAKERHKRGVFTSAVLSLLEEGVDQLTYEEVITNLPDLKVLQHPQCEGINKGRLLFDGKVAGRTCVLFEIKHDAKNGRYILEAGAAHGITHEAEFSIYPDRKVSTPSIGIVVASKVGPFRTECTVAPGSSLKVDCAFAHLTRVGKRQDFRLFVEAKEGFLDLFMRLNHDMQSTNPRRSILLLDNSDGADLTLTLTDNGSVQFHVMDKLCRGYGLRTMPFYNINVRVEGSGESLISILHSAVDFYWNIQHSNESLEIISHISFECFQLISTDTHTDDFDEILVPTEDNLVKDDTIIIDVDQDFKYGFKVRNGSDHPLYAALFYFDISDLSVATYYLPSVGARGQGIVSLPPKGELTIGFGDSGTSPWSYALRPNQDVDVGFLKLYLSTKYVDWSHIKQDSPFGEHSDRFNVPHPKDQYQKNLWHTLTIPVIQMAGISSEYFSFQKGEDVGVDIGGRIGIGFGEEPGKLSVEV